MYTVLQFAPWAAHQQTAEIESLLRHSAYRLMQGTPPNPSWRSDAGGFVVTDYKL